MRTDYSYQFVPMHTLICVFTHSLRSLFLQCYTYSVCYHQEFLNQIQSNTFCRQLRELCFIVAPKFCLTCGSLFRDVPNLHTPVSPTLISPIPISSTPILPTVKNDFILISPTYRKFSYHVFFCFVFFNSFIYLHMFIYIIFFSLLLLLNLSTYFLTMLIDNY